MKFFNIGKIVNTHGVRGELKVLITSDFADLRFKKGNRVHLFSPDESTQRTLVISGQRSHKHMILLSFEGVDSLTAAEQWKQWIIKIDEQQLHSLPEGEYYYHEIIGCEVWTDDDELLGTVTSILTPGANHVWVVRTVTNKELLLPVIDDVILHVDVQVKRIKVHLLEGLI